MAPDPYANFTVRSRCSAEDIRREVGWTLKFDVGIPAKQLFNIVYGLLFYLVVCFVINTVFLSYNLPPPDKSDPLARRLARSKQFWFRLAFFILAVVWGTVSLERDCQSCYVEVKEDQCDNWRLMFWYGLVLIITSNISSEPFEFYLGHGVSLAQTVRFYLRGSPLPDKEELREAAKSVEGAKGEAQGRVGFWTLMPSVFITWIFAKSIYNSAILGGMYGMYGGLAYASWYVSFFSAGLVCYLLRVRYGYASMASAVAQTYGSLGLLCYSFAILFRLFNEIWSNATVIGTFYGANGSSGYWGACWVSTLIPAVYSVMGGMRASLFSDVFQALLAVVFLVVVLSTIASDSTFSNATDAFSFKPAKGWYDDGWWTCFLGGLLQGIVSYPFFDPVLTDRGFLGTPRTMLLSFLVGGFLAAFFIFFYAVIGVYGTFYHDYFNAAAVCGCKGGSPAAGAVNCPTDWNPCSRISASNGDSAFAAWVLGKQTFGAVEIFINFIMITASMSTLDSTFTSWAKFVSLEFGGWLKLEGDGRPALGPLRPYDLDHIGRQHILLARGGIAALMVLGISYLGHEKDAMKATSAAGTMVMGMGMPIWMMTIWRTKTASRRGWVQAPLAFVVPFWIGFVFGYLYYVDGKEGEGTTYDNFRVGKKDDAYFYYSRFFGVNLIGHAICIGAFFVCFVFHQLLPKVWFWHLPEVDLSDGQALAPGEDKAGEASEGAEQAL